MTKLTQAQSDLLMLAAQSESGEIDQCDARTTAALIKRGFLIAVPKSEGASRLLITTSGRAAIDSPAPDETKAPNLMAAAEPEPPTPIPTSAPTAAVGKIDQLVALLQREEGATIAVLMEATGWQAHSVRGAISGTIKKRRGLTVTSEKTDAGRIYRVTQIASE